MEVFIVRSWKALALRGVAGVLFGVLAFMWPAITLVALVLVFGGYALVDGLLALAAATRQEAREHAWTLAVEGLLGVGVGLAAFLATGMTALFLANLIAFWAIFTGVLELILAVRLRRVIPGELLLAFSGAVSILLGFVILTRPGASAFVIVVLLGSYAFCFGAAMLILALRLRKLAHVPSGTMSIAPQGHSLEQIPHPLQ